MTEYVDLDKIKNLREKVNWKDVMERRNFLIRLDPLIENWKGELVNLWNVFQPEEIQRLLLDSAEDVLFDYEGVRGKRFIEFVIKTSYVGDFRIRRGYVDRQRFNEITRLPHFLDLHNYLEVVDQLYRYLFDTWANLDVNYFDEETRPEHFHAACKFNNLNVVEKFLELGQDPNALGQTTGNSALHLALTNGDERGQVIELLLRNGADPNIANRAGSTPLHDMCGYKSPIYDSMMKWFFAICDQVQRTVRVDARDWLGRTPLHLAVSPDRTRCFQLLLRKGADPNAASDDGTPLHVIAQGKHWNRDDTAKIFFDVCAEMQRTVRVDARDELGRTPLELALANIRPNTVDALLNHGADLSNCAFPALNDPKFLIGSLLDKTRVASAALAIAEHLERRGYDFSRSDALTIMKFFAKNDLFDKSPDLEGCWYDNEKFASIAKALMIKPNLSLYELIQLRPEEEEKLLAYTDYYEFTHHKKLFMIPLEYDDCFLHMLCEKLSREFFRRWALDPFYELIHKRLPILCCEQILEKLNNQDLCNICLAAA